MVLAIHSKMTGMPRVVVGMVRLPKAQCNQVAHDQIVEAVFLAQSTQSKAPQQALLEDLKERQTLRNFLDRPHLLDHLHLRKTLQKTIGIRLMIPLVGMKHLFKQAEQPGRVETAQGYGHATVRFALMKSDEEYNLNNCQWRNERDRNEDRC